MAKVQKDSAQRGKTKAKGARKKKAAAAATAAAAAAAAAAATAATTPAPATGPGPVAAAAGKPDIVVLLTDDQSQLDCTPYGAVGIRTPTMQQLADAGMTFTRAYVASPSCAPSRAALLTGLMPARNGAESNHSKPRAATRKWPAYFQELGYEVVAFGKVSHYRHTVDYGFDHFANDTFHDHAAITNAVAWLKTRKRDGAKPLCLFVGSNWPHVPWPETDLGYDPRELPLPAGSIDTPATRAWRARYAAAVTRADDDLGLVLRATRIHLPRKTLVLFSADHGAQWPFGKWNLYESGVCVPLIVVWPGVIRPGSRSDAMIQWVDFLPTLLEAAGGRAPANIDGRSFLPVLRGQTQTHRERIFTTHSNDNRYNVYPSRAVRDGDWKYIRNLHPEFAFTTHIDLVAGHLGQRAFFSTWEAAARSDPSAAAILKRYHARPAEELYNLATDPHEQRNLAANPNHAPHLATLRAALDAWMHAQGDARQVPVEPRLLSDPASHGPQAEIPRRPPTAPRKKAKP
ncbi:MAG: sulfatase [Verrucomicrobia bacterium]|nr:sulfatase [Verrucomicrobiota bacterium]